MEEAKSQGSSSLKFALLCQQLLFDCKFFDLTWRLHGSLVQMVLSLLASFIHAYVCNISSGRFYYTCDHVLLSPQLISGYL